MKAYKEFAKDLMCRGFQYKLKVSCEVFVNIPGEKAIHTDAEVEFRDNNLVLVHTPCGAVYLTHISNVVICNKRKGEKIENEK